jgi:transcriptional regulator with XRE-family HTH domain
MDFGVYFKKLRNEKKMTQQQIADAIGKSKMLVSGVETNKNGPFLDMDLELISKAMGLSDKEKKELMIEASKGRKKLPEDIWDYVVQNKEAYEILEVATERKFNKKTLMKILEYSKEISNRDV